MTTVIKQDRVTHKQRFWRRHIEQWSQSELSQAAYCREHKLKVSAQGTASNNWSKSMGR